VVLREIKTGRRARKNHLFLVDDLGNIASDRVGFAAGREDCLTICCSTRAVPGMISWWSGYLVQREFLFNLLRIPSIGESTFAIGMHLTSIHRSRARAGRGSAILVEESFQTTFALTLELITQPHDVRIISLRTKPAQPVEMAHGFLSNLFGTAMAGCSKFSTRW
jgi:hypothetical protein